MDQTMNKVERGISNTTRDVKHAITDVASKIENQIPPMIEEKFNALKEQTQLALDRTEQLVKKHPFYAILGAAAVGALVASYMSTKMTFRSSKH